MTAMIPDVEAWAETWRRQTVASAASLLSSLASDEAQGRLFARVLPDLERRAPAGRFSPAIHLPLACCLGAGGDEADATIVAAARLFLETAMDLLDHVWDGESEETWPGVDPRLVEALAVTIMAGVVPAAIARVRVPAAQLVALHRAIAEHLLRISAGEVLDLALFGRSDVTLDQVNAAVLGKTGERRALYATVGALVAGAPPDAVDAYAELGRHYGAARQITSDLVDLVVAPESRDLACGARTWPIVWGLHAIDRAERSSFADALARARGDREAAATVRQMLLDAGVELRGMIEVEQACLAALAALDKAAAREPGAGVLRAMLRATSLANHEATPEAAST
jgi:geranylgeranyl pyrophosphate synthase